MSQSPKLTFAPFVATACGLWIVAAITGSQGFTAIIGLLAIASLFFSRPGVKLPAYGWALLAALIWVSASSVWSPASTAFVSGSLTGEDFAVDVASIRVIGTALFAFLAISAATKIQAGTVQKSVTALWIITGVLCVLLWLTYFFKAQVLAIAYPGDPVQAITDGHQNIQRAANTVSVLLPVGLVAGWNRLEGVISRAIIVAGLIGTLLVFYGLNAQGAVLSFALMITGFALVAFLKSGGVKLLLGGLASLLLAIPFVAWLVLKVSAPLAGRLPIGDQQRLHTWEIVLGKIQERPITGHGMEAASTWKETYAAHPDWLEQIMAAAPAAQKAALETHWLSASIVPSHPHSMLLEIWAEAGLVGAAVTALALFLFVARIPSETPQNRAALFAAAGLTGAVLPLICIGYSAWNESFWGMLAVGICAVIVISKKAAT